MAQNARSGEKRQLANAVAESKAPAISRAAAVLRLLGRSDRPLSLQAVAGELGLVPSTCLYVLRALVSEGLVRCDADSKRYSLEAGVLTLARQWLRQNKFSTLAQLALDEISTRFDVTTLGVQIVGLDHIVVVAVAEAGRNFQLSVQIGSRFPALISATGRCIAAFGRHEPDELRKRFAALRWDEAPAFEHWMCDVARARTQGFAVDSGNYIAGVTVVSAPVWSAGKQPSHALIAVGVSGAMKRCGQRKIEQALLSAARRLSHGLNGEYPLDAP